MEKITSELGRTFYVKKGEDKHIKDRLSRKSFQKRNLQFVRKCHPINPIILDVGMHIGQNTIEYATWASEVHGFEPCKESFELAKMNIDVNNKKWSEDKYWWYLNSPGSLEMISDVFTYNVGLGAKEETVKLKHCQNSGHNQVSKEGEEQIQIKTLDSYNFKRVDIIKLDVEGYELFVLEGAKDTIKRCRPVVQLEVMESNLKTFRIKPQKIFDFFDSLDNYVAVCYKGFILDRYFDNKRVGDYFFLPGDLYDVLDKKVLLEQRIQEREKFKLMDLKSSRFYDVYDKIVFDGDKIKLRK